MIFEHDWLTHLPCPHWKWAGLGFLVSITGWWKKIYARFQVHSSCGSRVVSRVSTNGHLNITRNFGPYGHINSICLYEAATVTPRNLVHGRLPRSGGLPRTLQYNHLHVYNENSGNMLSGPFSHILSYTCTCIVAEAMYKFAVYVYITTRNHLTVDWVWWEGL